MAIRLDTAGDAGRAVIRQQVQASVRTWTDFLVELNLWPWAIAAGMGSGIAVGYIAARIVLGR